MQDGGFYGEGEEIAKLVLKAVTAGEVIMAKNLMIQGTMSNAGKSLMAAGILRVLMQDGYRAAPFKSQNMALNSYITSEGLEMGRAQVMQAEAAGIAPKVCMNPILLKPTSDVGSQVIVNGRVLGNYNAMEYFKLKKSLIPQVMEAYHTLEGEADIIVIEGAGSPAEINLKADDIVNMGLAELVDAPVLLVGDIDRGGVFAQLLGTVLLLEEKERARIKGFIINKFRGDAKLLAPGPEMLRQRCGIETLGIMPYLPLRIEDEDSLSEQLTCTEDDKPIKVAVIRLPHLSNFTDFNPLARFAAVSLQYVDRAEQLERMGLPDLLILPGSKNTMQDLKQLRESGMEAAVLKCAARGCRILGICGGYQMLGEEIADASGVEGGGRMRGLGLLPVQTIFRQEKTRTRMTGRITLGLEEEADYQSGKSKQDAPNQWMSLYGLGVTGYEIHMGESMAAAAPLCVLEDGRPDGCVCGRVAGTYLHGIFENTEFTEALLALLCEDRGMTPEMLYTSDTARSYQDFKESQYDMLADAVRKHLDMERVYEIIDRA